MSISSQLPPLPIAQGGTALKALMQAVGGTVEAKVLGQQPNGTTQVQIGGQVLNVKLTGVPNVGATLTLAVGQEKGKLTLTLASTAVRPQATSVPMLPDAERPTSATPQVALAQMMQQALPQQDSIVGLTTALAAVVGKLALPEAVMRAAQQVLVRQLPLDGGMLDGDAIARAVLNSGLFQEAKLAAGSAEAASGDLKTALLGLQKGLVAWLGNQVAAQHVSTLAPPTRGLAPRARTPDAAPLPMPDDLQEAGKVLLERTEAALSRLQLHQNASLPEPGQRQEAQWSFDLPVIIAGQQNVLQMQIHRDTGDETTRPEDRGWQVRFAINLGAPGEVGARISLRGASTGVLIWAEEAGTAAMLNENLAELRQDLAAAGLHPGSVLVRSGAPVTPPITAPKHFLDQTR